MINQNLNAPAFPCVPIQDNFGRLIAAIPGITKLEYFALKIYCNKDTSKVTMSVEAWDTYFKNLNTEVIKEAVQLLYDLEKYQTQENEPKQEASIISIS